jgi:flagellar basal body-associated protein FliL
MADESYDKSVGTKDRSVVAATKIWLIVAGIVLLLGITMIAIFFTGTGDARRNTGGPASENSASRPAEP